MMNMSSIIPGLIILILSLYGLGAILALALWRRPKPANVIPNMIAIIAALTGIVAASGHLLSEVDRIYLGNIITAVPYISLEMSVDRLAAFFILALSILTFAVSIYSIGYLTHYYQERNVGLFNFLVNGFVLAMVGVLIADNMIAFLIFWELMSLLSYFLVIYEAEEVAARKAGIIYLIMTHLASAFLLLASGLIYVNTGSLAISSVLTGAPLWVKNVLFFCFLIAFGTKAGIIPLHIWLPYAHPAAPSNISALMSGIMIKIAIYGLIRFVFGMLGAEFAWWGTTLLVAGIVTTMLGAAYALVEQNIKRLLAYCSIENIGIILSGLGVSCLAYSAGQMLVSALALTAALFHLLNHTIIKGTLFMGAGAILNSTHTKDMENLGGLLKKMPYTGLFMLGSSLAISAIPPFNGFVSEWLTYQAIFVNIATATIGIKVLLILTVAALAMAGAMAAASFIKFFGISFLGLPRSDHAARAQEAPGTMRWGMGLLTALSLLFGIFPLVIIRLLDQIAAGLTGVSMADKLIGSSFALYYPLKMGRSNLTPLALLITGLILTVAAVLIVRVLSRQAKERRYGTWDCGFTGLNSRMQYSATGFSKPLRIIFRAIYRPSRELVVEPGSSVYFPKSMKYLVATESVFEKYLYLPITGALTGFAKRFRMVIQTGSIHHYLIYMFVTILILLIYFRCCG
jgi:hydrogenase-4 component B